MKHITWICPACTSAAQRCPGVMRPDDKGASEPLQRTYNVILDSGHQLIYIASEPITRAEADKRLREKFRTGGKFINNLLTYARIVRIFKPMEGNAANHRSGGTGDRKEKYHEHDSRRSHQSNQP